MAGLNGDWYEALKGEFAKPYYKKLFETVNQEYRTRLIFPPADDIFNAFHLTPLKKVKVVILGQDPYHNNGQAHGLCFSVKKGVDIPPSLVNIYQELHDDLVPDKVGGAGRADAQYGSDRAGASGQFPPGDRLGRIHGRGDHGAQQPGPAHCVHPVGKSGPAQESHAEQSEASYPDGASSESALSVQRVFRQQAVQ